MAAMPDRDSGIETMTKQFEVGLTYSARSPGDYECSFEILARTETTVTIAIRGKATKRGLALKDNVETFFPFVRFPTTSLITAG